MLSASPGGFVYVIINHFDCVATLYSVNTHDMWSITCVYKERNLIYRYIVLVTYVRVTRDRRWMSAPAKTNHVNLIKAATRGIANSGWVVKPRISLSR